MPNEIPAGKAADAAVATQLGLDANHREWLADLASVEDVSPLPAMDRRAVESLLDHLRLEERDRQAVIRTLPTSLADPSLRWLLERCVARLVSGIGDRAKPLVSWPRLPDRLGLAGRCFFCHVFIQAVPAIRGWHQDRGVPDDVSWATLGDLGRHMETDRRTFGRVGLESQNWLTRPWRGLLFELGRLQFEPRVTGEGDPAAERDGPEQSGCDPGREVAIHIPESGPLDRTACGDSLARARPFFRASLPELDCRVATCRSWLLDPQLASYLDPNSNIVAFQSMFTLTPRLDVCDDEILTFVFRRTDRRLDRLPQRTSLERAVVAHLRQGGHWHARQGSLALPGPPSGGPTFARGTELAEPARSSDAP